MPIIFNNATKACFSQEKYTVSVQTKTAQIEYSISLIFIKELTIFFKTIDVWTNLSSYQKES